MALIVVSLVFALITVGASCVHLAAGRSITYAVSIKLDSLSLTCLRKSHLTTENAFCGTVEVTWERVCQLSEFSRLFFSA